MSKPLAPEAEIYVGAASLSVIFYASGADLVEADQEAIRRIMRDAADMVPSGPVSISFELLDKLFGWHSNNGTGELLVKAAEHNLREEVLRAAIKASLIHDRAAIWPGFQTWMDYYEAGIKQQREVRESKRLAFLRWKYAVAPADYAIFKSLCEFAGFHITGDAL